MLYTVYFFDKYDSCHNYKVIYSLFVNLNNLFGLGLSVDVEIPNTLIKV